ncbi:hypothetical protein CK203_060715 [Vitis vinifera]|uniref:Uncharacterized protein n=1 Tax=Vitis vinifera TaxID=29760 RepID=A0A438GCD0_VITVI|nr:hypothetical protein CK203_060715 [Vitis vinifera]
MDIVSPLPVAAAQKKLLLIATNYFSKWVESKAYASIKDKDVSKFVWRNIACLYGILQAIVAIIPTEIGMPTAKTTVQGQRDENQELKIHLDQADKSRGNVAI